MRDKILNIINDSQRNLTAIEIMDNISNKYDANELRSLIHELDLMCRDGILINIKGNKYKKNELIEGIIDVHDAGSAHLLMGLKDDIFIPRGNLKGACDKDCVLVDVINSDAHEGRVVKIVRRSLGKSLAEVVDSDGIKKIVPLDKTLPYEIEVEKNDFNLVDGLIVHLEYVKDISRGKVLAKITNIIGHKNAPGKDTKIACIASEFNIKLEFDPESKEQALLMPNELTENDILSSISEGRKDFRNDIIFTIDGKDTKDIDDAIGLKMLNNGNYELGVHIADVSNYVTFDSPLWNEAALRGNSNYLGNKVIPMLPVELSNGICSLNPNESRFTISVIMEIDHSGKVLNRNIVKGIIKSRKKMNYDAIQDIIESKETEDTIDYNNLRYIMKENDTLESIAFDNNMSLDELKSINSSSNYVFGSEINIPIRVIIKNMYSLSKILKSFKKRRGEIDFLSDEAKIIMDENDSVIEIKPRVQRESEELIENFMIVANETIAQFFYEENVPFVYRVHESPSPKKMEEYFKFLELLGIHYNGKINALSVTSKDCQALLEFLNDRPNYKVLNKKLLRSMKKAIYSTENLSHFGIASPCYTHFTSPIRRMSDLLVHRSITEYLINDNYDQGFLKRWGAYLNTLCEHISECERNSEKCEYAVDDMLKCDYMSKHILEDFEVTIDSLLSNSFFVQTDNLIDGRVDTMFINDKLVSINSYYEYNENIMAFTRNNRVEFRMGDRVKVRCMSVNIDERKINFALIGKL